MLLNEIAMAYGLELFVALLSSLPAISAAHGDEVPQECSVSLPAGYSKLIPPVYKVRSVYI